MALVLSTVHNIIIVVCFHLTYQGAGKTFNLLPFSYGGKKKRLNVILVCEITWEHWCAKDSCFGVQVLLSKWLCMEVRDAENLIWFFFFFLQILLWWRHDLQSTRQEVCLQICLRLENSDWIQRGRVESVGYRMWAKETGQDAASRHCSASYSSSTSYSIPANRER